MNEKFNIGDFRKIEIKLEGDILLVKNIGNVDYDGYILIYIGNKDETASIFLERGQTKRIKLTAPAGEYDIRIISEEETLEFKQVSLTGNVIGLESVLAQKNFWRKYPAVSLFLGVLMLIILAVAVLKLKNRQKN